jgi:hypothetical protein
VNNLWYTILLVRLSGQCNIHFKPPSKNNCLLPYDVTVHIIIETLNQQTSVQKVIKIQQFGYNMERQAEILKKNYNTNFPSSASICMWSKKYKLAITQSTDIFLVSYSVKLSFPSLLLNLLIATVPGLPLFVKFLNRQCWSDVTNTNVKYMFINKRYIIPHYKYNRLNYCRQRNLLDQYCSLK